MMRGRRAEGPAVETAPEGLAATTSTCVDAARTAVRTAVWMRDRTDN